jgi:hypothetical protein
MDFLDDAQLRKLTGRKRSDAQRRQLTAMGIVHRVRGDGTLAVLQEHVADLMGGASRARVNTPTEPNWGALCREPS